jgi:hypothetical protein
MEITKGELPVEGTGSRNYREENRLEKNRRFVLIYTLEIRRSIKIEPVVSFHEP